jgi:outer membrane protein OmpA-like peptidoglycan-associated protein
MRSSGVLILGLAIALCGCATTETARTQLVRAPHSCVDQKAQVYFEPGSADLTPEGRAVIDAEAASARSCQVRTVEVLGLADAAGAPEAALELSQRRAAAVSAALAANGLPPADFRVGAAGQAGAMTAEGARQPLRRRVEVTLRLAGR